jgi:biotin operon repressor
MQWTQAQRLLLKKEYNEVPVEELAEKLGRSVQAVRNQVSYLRKRGWTFKRVKDD